jgi:predicted nuclease with RNAse H fold
VLKLKSKVIIGIDLAGKEKNPTGFAVWKNARVETCLIYTDNEILEAVLCAKPTIVAIDAPLKLPKRGILRKADEMLIKKGYRVFPPGLPAMKTLTLRAVKLNKLIAEKGLNTIEIHPTSTRKALNMPTKDWETIQAILKSMGLGGTLEERRLTPHELDAVTAALTGYFHMQGLTEALGDEEEGYVIVPKKLDWRGIKYERL